MARDHTEIVNTDEFDEPRQMTRNLRPLNQMYDINKKMRPSKIGLISIMLLYSTYILLPLEAGFPRVKIFGFEVESSITFSVIAFFMACYVNKKDFIHFKIDNYIIFFSVALCICLDAWRMGNRVSTFFVKGGNCLFFCMGDKLYDYTKIYRYGLCKIHHVNRMCCCFFFWRLYLRDFS